MNSYSRSGRPQLGEYAPYAQSDIDAVAGDDAVVALEEQERLVLARLGGLEEDQVRGLAYAPGKWTVKEIVGHLADDERIYAYRALRLARNDSQGQPGFDENHYVRFSDFEERTLADLLEEYRTVRRASLSLFRGLSAEAWQRRGEVNGFEVTVRGLAFHIAGHELHHLRVLEERYLPERRGRRHNT